jgi:hypothetical protein
MSIDIYGGGMAGLIAAHVLRKHRPVIHEAQPSLPHNHEALLRFRDEQISEITGIPFKKVKVLKGIHYEGEIITQPTLRLGNMYSLKTNGTVRGRSIMNLDTTDRWIAPKDFVARLSEGVEIIYNSPLTADDLIIAQGAMCPAVSTIPMPVMMKMVGWPEPPQFNYKSIWAVTVQLLEPEVDVYQTLYYPGDESFYRCSITGNQLIIEFQTEPRPRMDDFSSGLDMVGLGWLARTAMCVLDNFGIEHAVIGDIKMKEQRFGKLVPIDETARRGFIMALSELYSIYSLGRFATWKPNLLMHDVVEDAGIVAGFIDHKDQYGRQLAMLKNRDRL